MEEEALDTALFEQKGLLRCVWAIYELEGCARLQKILAFGHLTKLRVDKCIEDGWVEEVGGDYTLTPRAIHILLPQILAIKDYAKTNRRRD